MSAHSDVRFYAAGRLNGSDFAAARDERRKIFRDQ
jgi:hypothetical protein